MPAKEPATSRILNAARVLVERGGAAEVSMGDVAGAAGVSKALVHYHFRDKDSLLRALVENVGQATLARARESMTRETGRHALDEYWSWLETELHAGDVRILLSLAEYDSEQVRAASRRVARQRRDVAAEHVSLVFARLSLNPRVPVPVLAETVLAFVDGLAAGQGLEPSRDPRPAFDVLWLALLTLAE